MRRFLLFVLVGGIFAGLVTIGLDGQALYGQCGSSGCGPTFTQWYYPPPTYYYPAQPMPAAPPPAASSVPAPKQENFGVEWDKIEAGASLNQKPISVKDATAIIEGKIPDERNKFVMVAIGTAEERKPVAEAYENLDAATKGQLRFWGVPPDHWSLQDTTTGKPVFVTAGHPTVYVQSPDGKPLHRQDDWKGAEDIQAIRKAIKSYDPGKDPDLRKPIIPPLIPNPLIPNPLGGTGIPWLVALGGAGTALLLRRKGVV